MNSLHSVPLAGVVRAVQLTLGSSLDLETGIPYDVTQGFSAGACIPITCKACETQIAGPTSVVFDSVGLG